jgi:hypothetical protein
MELERAFRILRIPRDVSLADAKKRFRQLVLCYHPDRSGTTRTERQYKLVVEAFRTIEGFLVNGPAEEEGGDLEFGTLLNILELRLGGKAVPVETIGKAILSKCSYKDSLGMAIVIHLSEPWYGGKGKISAILELDSDHGQIGGKMLSSWGNGDGGLMGLEFEPQF